MPIEARGGVDIVELDSASFDLRGKVEVGAHHFAALKLSQIEMSSDQRDLIIRDPSQIDSSTRRRTLALALRDLRIVGGDLIRHLSVEDHVAGIPLFKSHSR